MGVESRKAPPLPAPTETESLSTPTEVATDVSKLGDDNSSYSLPEDGTPVTIKTRGHRANKSQTSLLIEYFEGGKVIASGSGGGSGNERRPSVRVRLTPSKNRGKSDHIQITETRSTRKTSLTRRSSLPTNNLEGLSAVDDGDDARSMNSYASATEESNVSRNPIEVEIDRSHRRRRPASPLIPTSDSKVSYQAGDMSEISAIPTDSFLDGSGPAERRSSKGPGEALVAGAAAGLAGAVAADKVRSKSHGGSKERPVVPKGAREKERKHRSKSRASSVSEREGERYEEDARSSRRRSSRNHQESVISGADSSVMSSAISPSHKSLDQHSMRSGTSKSSINNPKLLETVEDAIRRLILPELNALKREHSKRSERRGSFTSSTTSLSREDVSTDRRRSGGDKHLSVDSARDSVKSKERRDREARENLTASPSVDEDSVVEESFAHHVDDTPKRSSDGLKTAAAGTAVGGLAAAALNEKVAPEKTRRRRRAEMRANRSAERFEEDYDSDHLQPVPPMPLMSEINPSELTRTSILSADTDRPHSASEEITPIHEVIRGSASVGSTPTPATRTPNLQAGLGTQHSNISQGDLKILPTRRKTGEYAGELGIDENGHKLRAHQEEEYEDEYEESSPDGQSFGTGYYNTQDVPAPLNYVPYHPETRGLSPIPSVSGYTEGGSEMHQRDSRASKSTRGSSPSKHEYDAPRSPAESVPSNLMSRNFEEDDRSVRSSGVGNRNTMYTEDSEVDHVTSGQAVRGVGANPRFVNTPLGVESAVASLVDGSMLDQSTVLSSKSGREPVREYYSSGDEHASRGSPRKDGPAHDIAQQRGGSATPSKKSVHSQRESMEERGASPASRTNPSQEFSEYEVDEYGRKVPRERSRHSPTASEVAITGAAVGAAAAALRAAKGKDKQPTVEEVAEEEFEPVGVQRNKSFKQRTMEGRKPANTPTHSVDRLDDYDNPKMGFSGLPDPNLPEPDYAWDGYDEVTNPSLLEEPHNETTQQEDSENWRENNNATPVQRDYQQRGASQKDSAASGNVQGIGMTEAAAAGAALATAAALAHSHSRQASQDQEEEWHRTSDDRKRDTLVTNPYEGASPIANLPGANDILGGTAPYGATGYSNDYNARSPLGHKGIDEGYISQGPNKTPDIQFNNGKGVDFVQTPGAVDDPFYAVTKTHGRHLSGMSQGMGSPFYDAANGYGIDRIESRDIIALMQHLMVRDAQRSARDTDIIKTLVSIATEMRSSFRNIEDLLSETGEDIVKDVQVNTEKIVRHHIGGPRPLPGSAGRSVKSQADTDDLPAKRRNLFRRALKGLSAKGNNDLGRIEDMLMQLLGEVDVLKMQTAPTGSPVAGNHQTYDMDNMQPEVQYEQDRGYEPEGNAGTSTASHASQSGHLSIPQSSRGASTKLGYERKFSDHRISTVHEANEDEFDHPDTNMQTEYSNPDMLMTPHKEQRADSVPLDTPPQATVQGAPGSQSLENTPRTDEGKKHKSRGSSGWGAKISRWSETTASSVGRAFRSSTQSRKEQSGEDYQGPSRSGSALDEYDDYGASDPYGEDKLHSGFSESNLANPPQAQSPVHYHDLPPQTYSTPEDPKYRAHRNSLNLQHPQPRQGQTERFKVALESQAHDFDTPNSPRSADWQGSVSSLQRYGAQRNNRYSDASAADQANGNYERWASSPTAGPPRPPKEPLDHVPTPPKGNRISKLAKSSPLPYHSVESGYGTATANSHSGSPRLENRNLSGALGVPARRPSGPRAMTPTRSVGDEGEAEARRRKRDTFGTVASEESETF